MNEYTAWWFSCDWLCFKIELWGEKRRWVEEKLMRRKGEMRFIVKGREEIEIEREDRETEREKREREKIQDSGGVNRWTFPPLPSRFSLYSTCNYKFVESFSLSPSFYISTPCFEYTSFKVPEKEWKRESERKEESERKKERDELN